MLSSHVNLLIFYAYSEEFTTFAPRKKRIIQNGISK